MKYVINEHFETFQGEGVHMGRHAYFIRLQGCDQSCHFCDSASTWHPDFKFDNPKMDAHEIAAMVARNVSPCRVDSETPFVVVTGGEPCLWNLQPLTNALRERNFRTHLETAGHRPITGDWHHIALSPKPFATHPTDFNIAIADEFKLIVESAQSLADSLECIATKARKASAVVWLHPEYSKRRDPEILRLISETVKNPPINADVRAGWQLHTLYSVDLLDANATSTREFVPLGGVSKGGPA